MGQICSDEWVGALRRELTGFAHENNVVDAAFVNMVTHAPMPPRLRNELINRGYSRMATRLNALLHYGAADTDMAPNFFCFAHWASSYVGRRMNTWRGRPIRTHLEDGNAAVFHSMSRAFLGFERELVHGESREVARTAVEREIPASPRVNAHVDGLVDESLSASTTWLNDVAFGLPEGLLNEIDQRRERNGAALLQGFRDRGFDEYRRAIAADGESRRRAILRGNAWLVVSEQAMVDPALCQAMRSLVRAATQPIQAVTRSRRSRWADRTGPIRGGFEDAWIELVSKTLEWASPDGVMPEAQPLRFRRNGSASVHRFIKRAAAKSLPSGSPFCHFAVPSLEEEPLFWTALSHRLPVIFAVLQASHDGPWFIDGTLREHSPWPAFDRVLEEFLRASQTHAASSDDSDATRPMPHEQRRQDWATAHRLFVRDRELIFAALFTHSLPSTYTSPAGAALLDLGAHNVRVRRAASERALVDDSLPRLRESKRFVDAMFQTPEPPGSPAGTLAAKGRSKGEWLDQIERVHAHVRQMIDRAVYEAGPRIGDRSLFADPLGYDQCIGAGTSFVVPVVQTLTERFGVSWSDEERDSWSRVWVEITFHQGLDAVLKSDGVDDHLCWGPDYRPVLSDFGFEDLVHADAVIRARHSRRSMSGVRLADKLRRDLEDALVPMLRPLVRVGFDVFGDGEVNRILMIPRSRLTPAASAVANRLPALTRCASRWFIRRVLREVDAAQPIATWDEVYAPGPDPRRIRKAKDSIQGVQTSAALAA